MNGRQRLWSAVAVFATACVILTSPLRASFRPASPSPAPGVVGESTPSEPAIQTAAEKVSVTSGSLQVQVQRQPWAVAVRVDGATVYSEFSGVSADTDYGTLAYQRHGDAAWYHVAGVSGAEEIRGGERLHVTTTEPGAGDGTVEITAPITGTLRMAFQPPPGQPVAWTVSSAPSASDEMFLGLGERFDGAALQGRRLELWTADRREANYGDSTYLPVPWLISSRGYGFLLDDDRRSTWELRSQLDDAWAVGVPGAGLAYVLTGGPPAIAIERYTALTGRPPLPPKWGLGVIKTLTGGEQQVLADAARLKADDVPVDGIYVFDATDDRANIGWRGAAAGLYKDLRQLNASLRTLGYHPLGYFGPDFHIEQPSFGYPYRHGFLVRDANDQTWVNRRYQLSLLDFTNTDAARWWQSGPLMRAIHELGFEGGMLDLGEAVPTEARFGSGLSGSDAHNAFPVAFDDAAYSGLKRLNPDGLFWMRSGYTGAQRFHAATWSGDPVHDWSAQSGFRSMVPAAVSAGLAGYAYWHTEVGGYVDGGLEGQAERELYVRWLELGAFTAMLRDAQGERASASGVWSDDQTLQLWRRYSHIHEALVPYLWRTAQQATETGLPLIRHLAIMFPDDRRAWGEDQEFMLGNDLLVAPVVDAGATVRTAYLPAGQWTFWWTGQVYTGPADVTVSAPLDQIPVFIREGATSPLPEAPIEGRHWA